MKKLLFPLFLFLCFTSLGQEPENLQKIFRVNMANPSVELEYPLSNKATLSANTGIGIQGSYLNLSYTNSGVTYFIAPFLDLSYKKFYNRDARLAKGKSIDSNSGNYWSIRLLSNFNEIESHNIIRKDRIDFAFGPTWGLQRAYGDFHLLFDMGPVYYFDTKGNTGFFPIMLQLNIGFDIKKWQ